MPDDLLERLLVTCAELGEAMVIQNVLEAEGIGCRTEDLGHVPNHMLGIAGGLRRSVAVYVLDVDVERARVLLASLSAPENAVDEATLAAEAEAAASPPPAQADPEQDHAMTCSRSLSRAAPTSRTLSRAVVAALLALAALLVVLALMR